MEWKSFMVIGGVDDDRLGEVYHLGHGVFVRKSPQHLFLMLDVRDPQWKPLTLSRELGFVCQIVAVDVL